MSTSQYECSVGKYQEVSGIDEHLDNDTRLASEAHARSAATEI